MAVGEQGKLVVEALLSRRKAKKDLEYEVKWWGLPSNPKHNKWYNRAKCVTPPPPTSQTLLN